MMNVDYQTTAPVFNIQTYCIHDGPGIRTTVFVKGCPLRCLWCANPESNLSRPELMTYAGKCTGCGRCVPACPRGAVSVQKSGGTFVAMTDRALCVNCGVCTAACGSGARELTGRMATVQEALDKVLKDKIFYDASGGGMTIGGGEPLVYPDFSANLFAACKLAGVSTAIETSSFASRAAVDQVFAHVDLGLLDIKHMDPVEHKRLTGVSNEQILDNIRHVCRDLRVPVIVRIPTIPGCNDSDQNIEATARFVSEELGTDTVVHLLPYHKLGISKSESLGRKEFFQAEPPSDEHMRHLLAIIESYGLTGQIGG